MVLDTSVLLHILFEEPGWDRSTALIRGQKLKLIGAPSLVEASAVVTARGIPSAGELLQELLTELGVEIASFGHEHVAHAQFAYERFGKGRHSMARLNLGDVFSYALAKQRQDRLAFVGADFVHTDLEVVRLPPGQMVGE